MRIKLSCKYRLFICMFCLDFNPIYMVDLNFIVKNLSKKIGIYFLVINRASFCKTKSFARFLQTKITFYIANCNILLFFNNFIY